MAECHAFTEEDKLSVSAVVADINWFLLLHAFCSLSDAISAIRDLPEAEFECNFNVSDGEATSDLSDSDVPVCDHAKVAARLRLQILYLTLRLHVELVTVVGELWEDEGHMVGIPDACRFVGLHYALTDDQVYNYRRPTCASAPPSPRRPLWGEDESGKIEIFNSLGQLIHSDYGLMPG